MAEIYLIRHGQASFGAENYDQLSELGAQQSLWLGEHLTDLNVSVDGLLMGELARHRQTAEALCDGAGLQLQPEIHAGLNEFDFQSVVNAYLAQNPVFDLSDKQASPKVYYRLLKEAMSAWQQGQLVADQLPESWQQFSQRVAAVLDHIRAAHADRRRLLVVTSGGVIAMCMKHMLGTDDRHVIELNLQIRNSSVTQVFYNRDVLRLAAFNQVAHLEQPQRQRAITYS